MSTTPTVTINGQDYDAVTGLPVATNAVVAAPAEAPKPHSVPTPLKVPATNAHSLHAKTQRSQTLSRKFTKKPTPAKTTIITRGSKPSMGFDIRPTKHQSVQKFAPHPVITQKPATPDIGPITHPHVAKAHAVSAAKANPVVASQPTAAQIKTHSLHKAVENTVKPTKEHKTSFWQHRQRVTGILTATLALVLLGGYFTYLNMPSLSVRVAAAQAGINAAFPDYRPDGYAMNGPVTYSDGRVAMAFKANAGNSEFKLNQSKSGWSSDAVLDNYVTPRAGSSYIPYSERGLTIYTFNNNAAWVNGGILYTIDGDAPLSSEQIRRIATSLL